MANKEAKLLRGGIITGPTDSIDAVVVESRELRNEKRYTVRELLASDEAMKDLLHERLLAVRDDLNFAINACNPSASVNGMRQSIERLGNVVASMEQRMGTLGQEMRQVKTELALTNAALDGVRGDLQRQPRWWKTAWKKLKAVRW